MKIETEIKFYFGDNPVARCYADKNKKKKWEIYPPHDLLIYGYDEEMWIFLEDGTRDKEIRTIGDLLIAVFGKEAINKIKQKEY
jgi:uncharacterized protein YvpB